VNNQLPLITSIKYQGVWDYLINIGNMKPDAAHAFINKYMPRLYDSNYMGHDENGNPCKSLLRGKL